jgi:hypothetical protein
LVYEKSGFPTSPPEEQMLQIEEMKNAIDSVSGPLIELNLWLPTDQAFFEFGDNFILLLDLLTPAFPVTADIYFALLNHVEGTVYFATSWSANPAPAVESLTLPSVSYSGIELLPVTLPSEVLSINESGFYTFAIAATQPGTGHFISNMGTWVIEVRE